MEFSLSLSASYSERRKRCKMDRVDAKLALRFRLENMAYCKEYRFDGAPYRPCTVPTSCPWVSEVAPHIDYK